MTARGLLRTSAAGLELFARLLKNDQEVAEWKVLAAALRALADRFDVEIEQAAELSHGSRIGSLQPFYMMRRLDTPLTPGEPPALIPCRICGKDGYCGTHNDRNSDDPDEEDTLPPEPPAKCKTCGGERKLLHFYSRGPGDPPGNAMGPCPDCTPSLPREPEATPIIVHAFMDRKEPLCEHDYSMFRENESVVSTDSLAVNCKTCLEIRDVAREPEAKACEACSGAGVFYCGDVCRSEGAGHECKVCNGRGRLPLNPRAR